MKDTIKYLYCAYQLAQLQKEALSDEDEVKRDACIAKMNAIWYELQLEDIRLLDKCLELVGGFSGEIPYHRR